MSYNAPPPGYPQPMGMPPAKPNNYLVWSILTTLFCCLPLGIVAIISSTKVDSLYTSGQYVEANAAAASAKKWNLWGLGLALVGVVGYVVIVVIAALGSSTTGA